MISLKILKKNWVRNVAVQTHDNNITIDSAFVRKVWVRCASTPILRRDGKRYILQGDVMNEASVIQQLNDILQEDEDRMSMLNVVASQSIPQSYIAAGFVRNMVWDYCHQNSVSTPLADIDVIYFDAGNVESEADLRYQAALEKAMPNVNWQVKNQARMHVRNGHPPYMDIVDAMRFWPEMETAVAVRLTPTGMKWCSGFGLARLFAQTVTHNPARPMALFEQRLKNKNWQQRWPNLRVVLDEKQGR